MSAKEKWEQRYNRGWATKSQLQQLVQLQVLTEQDYKDITGEDYPS